MSLEVNPYLVFDDNCEEAFNFYKGIFGGEFQVVMRFKDMPPDDRKKMQVAEDRMEKIMHIAMPLGNTAIMGSDNTKDRVVGNNAHISLNVTDGDLEKAKGYFTGLSDGGDVIMPMTSTFWGAQYGKCTDKFGVHWQINCEGTRKKAKTDEGTTDEATTE